MNKGDITMFHFWYKTKNIFDDLYSRTSFIGKHRKLENGDNMLEDISFSRDEAETLFDPLLRQAMSKVYFPISVHNRELPQQYETYAYDSSTDLNEISDTRHSVYYAIKTKDGNKHLAEAVDTAIYEALINYVLWQWLLIANPQEALIYESKYNGHLSDVRSEVSKLASFGIGQVTRHIY